jgi:hypothetical protein
MRLWLDTEFSHFGGQLISIAIVSDDDDRFYAVRHLPSKIHPWVVENVVPLLTQDPEPDHEIKRKLVAFLRKHSGKPICADWPEDFIFLLGLLCEPGGYQFDVGDLELKLIRGLKTKSVIPHHAVHDARALRDAFYGEGDLPDGD